MRIVFFLACWRRPEITELCFVGLQRLAKHDPVRFDVRSFAVISEESMIPLCKKYGIDFLMHDNEPVGAKKNAGLNEVLNKYEFDYLIELGSDDLIFNGLLDYYEPLMKAGEDFFASKNIAFVDGIGGGARLWQYDPNLVQGLGRCLSRRLLDSMRGKVLVKAYESILSDDNLIASGTTGFLDKDQADIFARLGWAEIIPGGETFLWSNINRGLDNDSTDRIMRKGYTFKLVETPEPFMVDIKSQENIWGYNPELGEAYDLDKFLAKLSKVERQMFFATQKKLKARLIETAA